MKKELTLYNIAFPVWFILLIPYTWIILLPLHFGLVSLLLLLSLVVIGSNEKKKLYKKLIWKVWGFGLLGNIIGYLCLFIMLPISSHMVSTSQSGIIVQLANGIMDNPYDNIYSILWVIISYLVGIVASYYLHSSFTFANVALSRKEKRIIILIISIISGPWLGLLG